MDIREFRRRSVDSRAVIPSKLARRPIPGKLRHPDAPETRWIDHGYTGDDLDTSWACTLLWPSRTVRGDLAVERNRLVSACCAVLQRTTLMMVKAQTLAVSSEEFRR